MPEWHKKTRGFDDVGRVLHVMAESKLRSTNEVYSDSGGFDRRVFVGGFPIDTTFGSFACFT